MKTNFTCTITTLALFLSTTVFAQEEVEDEVREEPYRIQTIFRTEQYASGGYAALGNKFTTINGSFVNMPEIYGGWFINHKFMLGIGAAAATNKIPVPYQYRTEPDVELSYAYGQVGFMIEYILWNHRALHFSFQFFNGGAFTAQYDRDHYVNDDNWDEADDVDDYDANFFFVTEPGVKVELNIFKWMRFCPGVSYRATFGSNGAGLPDSNVSAPAMNFTMKFGKF
jgi:hypothetical protein